MANDKHKMPSNVEANTLLQLKKQLGLKTAMGEERLKVALEAVKLFDRKQHDYGSKNIAFSDSQEMNAIGVAIRLNDKIQRMLNLSLKKIKGTGAEVKDESLEDTAVDICNYGAILTMILTNRWK
jgi:hypothetical protein